MPKVSKRTICTTLFEPVNGDCDDCSMWLCKVCRIGDSEDFTMKQEPGTGWTNLYTHLNRSKYYITAKSRNFG